MESQKKILKIVMLLLSAGVLLSAYLYLSKILNTSVICPTNGCEVVDSSPYSYLFGVPISLWGIVYYLGMFVITLLVFKNNGALYKKLLYLGTAWGVIYTLYLRYVEITKIGAFCPWCWGSVLVIIGLTYYVWRFYREEGKLPE